MTQSGSVSFASHHDVRHDHPAKRHRCSTRVANLAFTLAALLCAAPLAVHAQQGTVSGAVLVEGAQRPLAGAQVTIEGQTTGATTDASGRFRLTGLTGTSVTLNVRALGYRPETQTVPVGSTNVRFVLSTRAVELNQVVVTGTAGGEQLRSLGTSVATVNVADVAAKTAVPSMDALLNGRTPTSAFADSVRCRSRASRSCTSTASA